MTIKTQNTAQPNSPSFGGGGGRLSIIKIGGNVIDNADELQSFLSDFAKIEGPKILVHGGGKLATQLAKRLDIATKMIDGRRVTDKETLDIVTMVYAGLINKNIVSRLQALGCNAVGLSGADANVIPAAKRSAVPVDFGFVGDVNPDKINSTFIATLLQNGITPVFCAITNGENSLLNSNADTVASSVAIAIAKIYTSNLIFCFEKNGVLKNIDDENSVIAEITRQTYAELKSQGVINAGMLPKIDNAFKAIDSGVNSVIIKNSRNLLKDFGTVII